MKDFIAEADRELLSRHAMADFDALWALQLTAVDEPNIERGGWSSVFRLELEGLGFYLKRQSNHLTRSLAHPFGEPTFAREFRAIRQFQLLGIPALQASFFACRRIAGEQRAVLLTRALDDWQDLDSWLARWSALSVTQRSGIVRATGAIAHQLHAAGQMHGCFYPKHIFLREQPEGWQARLIDLEKTRPLLLGRADRVKDLEPLLRRAPSWGDEEVRWLLGAYLQDEDEIDGWADRLNRRRQHKAARA